LDSSSVCDDDRGVDDDRCTVSAVAPLTAGLPIIVEPAAAAAVVVVGFAAMTAADLVAVTRVARVVTAAAETTTAAVVAVVRVAAVVAASVGWDILAARTDADMEARAGDTDDF
jgi:hypothetical protein